MTIASFTIMPQMVDYGAPAQLSWVISGQPTSLTIKDDLSQGAPIDVLGTSSILVHPVRRQTFTLTATSQTGTSEASVTIAARGIDALTGPLGGTGFLDGVGQNTRLNQPYGIAGDPYGYGDYFITDSETVRVLEPNGTLTTIAGAPLETGSADGLASDSRFDSLASIVLTETFDGYLIADRGNHEIRKLLIDPYNLDGGVVTYSGSPSQSANVNGVISSARYVGPTGLAYSYLGDVYISDPLDHTVRRISYSGDVSTFMGISGVSGSIDGDAGTATLDSPQGMTYAGDDNLYLADSLSNTIRRIDPSGTMTTIAGVAGQQGLIDGAGAVARFNGPTGVADLLIARTGTEALLVADTKNNVIRKIELDGGDVTTVVGVSGVPLYFNRPTNTISVGGGDFVVVSQDAITRVSSNGDTEVLAGRPAQIGQTDGVPDLARFNQPRGLAVGSNGVAYVADTANCSIRKIDRYGLTTTLAGQSNSCGDVDGSRMSAALNLPYAVAVDGANNVYFTEIMSQTVRSVTPTGYVSTIAGTLGAIGTSDGTGPNARFNNLTGIAVDSFGEIYVADAGNYTIRKITALGVVSTVAGVPGQKGSVDDHGSSARLGFVTSIAIGANNLLYVADEENHTIRTLSPTGDLVTLAGSPGQTGNTDGTGSNARFSDMSGIAVDVATGNAYVVSLNSHFVRRVTPTGLVTTVVGHPMYWGVSMGPLPGAINTAFGVAATSAGDLLVSTENSIIQITAP